LILIQLTYSRLVNFFLDSFDPQLLVEVILLKFANFGTSFLVLLGGLLVEARVVEVIRWVVPFPHLLDLLNSISESFEFEFFGLGWELGFRFLSWKALHKLSARLLVVDDLFY